MKTILTAVFRHETNRTAPGVTGWQDFHNRYALYEETAIRERIAGAKEEMNAFLEYFGDLEGYDIKPVLALNASPGPVVAQEVFDDTCAKLVEAVQNTDRLDGILLCLHGAMVTENSEDGEGELLEALRSAAGKDVPIVATLDLHANVSQKMMDNATALFAYYNNPHTDSFDTGMRASKCLHDILEGKVHPVMGWKMVDVLVPVTPTAHPSMAPFREKAIALSGQPGMIDVSICHGFYKSDIYGMGLSVLAVTDGNAAKAQQTAESLCDEMFAAREEFRSRALPVEDAVKLALSADTAPVVLADLADNPGSGASTDSTELLRTLVKMGAKDVAFAVMYDPEVVRQAVKAGVGSTIEVALGGKVAPKVTGGPVQLTAYVKAITDGQYHNRDEMSQGLLMKFGTCALLVSQGIQIIVCSVRAQPWDLEIYRHIGIRPEDMKILVVKSAAHFRASFGKVASQIIEVDAPGLAAPNPAKAGLKHVRRPIYPLDVL